MKIKITYSHEHGGGTYCRGCRFVKYDSTKDVYSCILFNNTELKMVILGNEVIFMRPQVCLEASEPVSESE